MESPYASPQADPCPRPSAFTGGHIIDEATLPIYERRLVNLALVAVAWEKLRIWYNAVLAVVALLGLVVIDASLLLDMQAMKTMVFAAIAANVCFCVGPLVEGYVTWFFGKLPGLRAVIFAIGIIGAVMLTIWVVANVGMESITKWIDPQF
jgi:hypothetical protein